MSFLCPHCQTEVPERSKFCSHCGQQISVGTKAPASLSSDSRFPIWKILPWTVLVAAVILLLPHLRSSHFSMVAPASAKPSAQRPAAPMPVPHAVPRLKTASAPLTVTLFGVSQDRHIPIGRPVMISAYAGLPPGKSASLAVFYTVNGGAKMLLSLAQGSLSSTSWAPITPGHYCFTASAATGKTSALSRRLSLWVDAPPQPRTAAFKTNALKTVTPRAAAPKPASAVRAAVQSSVSPAYHVGAASFPIRHIADTLANALRKRGFHAFVRPGTGLMRRSYTVETGDYLHRDDAQAQVRLLKRDGYPAFAFHLSQ